MPDHFHLVARPEGNDLSKIMKIMKMKFAGAYRLGANAGRPNMAEPFLGSYYPAVKAT